MEGERRDVESLIEVTNTSRMKREVDTHATLCHCHGHFSKRVSSVHGKGGEVNLPIH